MSTRRYRRDPQRRECLRPGLRTGGRYGIQQFAPGAAPPELEAWAATKEAQIAAGEVLTGRSPAAAERLVAALVRGGPVEVDEDTWLEFIELGTPGPIPPRALFAYFEALGKPGTPRTLVAGVPRVIFGEGRSPNGAWLYAWAEEEVLAEKLGAHRFMLQEVPAAVVAGEGQPPRHDLLVAAPVLFDPPGCAACGPNPAVAGAADRQRFRELTGREWPGATLSLNFRQDRTTLSLPTTGLPERVSLCLPCAVGYMERFNALNAARKTEE